MNLDFDIDSIRNNKIELLDCQVDLILKSLEFYCYTYEFIYPRTNKSKSTEENLRISLVTDTYHQILGVIILRICLEIFNKKLTEIKLK